MSDLNKEINKTSNTINVVAIIIAAVFLGIIYWQRYDLLPLLTFTDYLSLFSLVSVIIILPDFVSSRFKCQANWYCSIEFSTIVLVSLLGLSGLILTGFSVVLRYIAIPVGLFLILWEIYRFSRFRKILPLIFGSAVVGFLVLIFYSQGWHTPLFPEHIILGTGFVDILFHTSISNMFSTVGYATTGLDGVPYLHYHWGAHALFAGLREWIAYSTIFFYNIAYPLIFIPLFFKALLLLTHRVFIYKKQFNFNIIIAFTAIALLYSTGIIGFSEARAMPMNSESFGLSVILMLLFFSVLINYLSKKQAVTPLLIFAVIIVSLLFLFKISTGLVVFTGLSYLLIRLKPDLRSLLIVVLNAFGIGVLVYLFIYPIYRNEVSISIGNRLLNYWYWSSGFITYFTGLIIFLAVLVFETKPQRIYSLLGALRSGKYIDLELLAVINAAGAGAALWVTSNSGDVYYFFAVQLILSVVYIIYYFQKAIDQLKFRQFSLHIFMALLVIMCILSLPHIIGGLFWSNSPNKHFSNLSKDQKVLKELVLELGELDRNKNKSETTIYIPREETWYHNPDSSFKEIFIIPAISGMAAIKNIPDKLLRSGFNYFSIAYYRKENEAQINTIDQARSRAKRFGYDELIVYREKNHKLEKILYKLD